MNAVCRPVVVLGLLAAAACGGQAAWAETALVPRDSAMVRDRGAGHLRLVAPLTSTAGVHAAGWKLSSLKVETVTEPTPRLGATALQLSGVASSGGAKGDFGITGGIGGEVRHLGLWVHVAQGANVSRVGLQFTDAEGEAFLVTRDVDWTGWRWVEFDLAAGGLPQAWKQAEKNQRVDAPLRGVHFAWFTREAGPSAVVINALAAASTEAGQQGPVLAAPDYLELNQPAQVPVVINNALGQQAKVEIEYELQRDPHLVDITLPDPVHGSDHAAGAASWTEHKGEEVERGSLTDARRGTAFRLPWGSGYQEMFQYVELDEVREISHLAFESGDANWTWNLDVAASPDGENWQDIPSLQGVDIHKKWGRQALPLETPFEARYLRLRFSSRDGEEVNTIAGFSRLSVFDGVADESWELPEAGPVVASGRQKVEVAPRAFDAATIGEEGPLPTGAYLLAVRVRAEDQVHVLAQRMFVMPEPMTPRQQGRARVGLNSSTASFAPIHQRLGIGWVRFENLKWRMASPGPDRFVYDGLPPWVVDHDGYIRTMREHEIEVLPYLFLSPEWGSSAPADAKHRAAWPPADYADYGEFVFQTVARYGSVKHDPGVLKTDDKLSGLGLLSVYEIWNEPNLNDPGWGHWVGPLEDYFELLRVGAEAAKRADPAAKVANGGFAGITVGLVDQLRSYEYADGKRPLDFVDVLSVHTYTGATPPEESVVDTNVDRSGNTQGSVSHEEHLRRLDDWRDQHRPKMPIWMTETGYDTGGPRGVSERLQAAYNVRNSLMMLAEGIDKVLIYREAGSGNSLYAASGLIRDDGSLKPSWFAIATLLRELDEAEELQRLPHADEEVYLYGWQREGTWRLAAWTIGDRQPLGLNLGSARVTDAFGGSTSVDDAGTVELSDMPIYLSDLGQPSTVAELAREAETRRAAWQAQRRSQAERAAYLFDFGTDEHVGSTDIGRPRPFTPVPAETTYTAQRGHGFHPRAAERNEDAHWIRSPTQRDGCRVGPEVGFRADVVAGSYTVTVRFSPQGGAVAGVVSSADGASRTLTFTRDQPEQTVEIEVDQGPLEFSFERHGSLSFITIVGR